MKHAVLALLLSSPVHADDIDDMVDTQVDRIHENTRRTIDELDTYSRPYPAEPIQTVPIPPSSTGPSYYGPQWTYTQEQSCFRSMTGYMRCSPR